MDKDTVILLLAIGSFVFGFLLILFQYRKDSSRKIPFWVPAKFLQGTGSLLLYLGSAAPGLTTTAANISLLLGCAYEGWTILHITERRVSSRLHLSTTFGIVSVFIFSYYLNIHDAFLINFPIHAVFYTLPGWALLSYKNQKTPLRLCLGLSYLLLAALFSAYPTLRLCVPEPDRPPLDVAAFTIIPPATYCMMLISGFSMLLIVKEKVEEALEESHRQLEALSNIDGLTGISNRRHFDAVLAKEYARHVRSGANLSLILLDIDHFKEFNDAYGHVQGDDCLRQVARVLAECGARSTDLAARYGGEEFACILPETDLHGALVVAEQIRRSIQALAIPHEKSRSADCVTASLGVVTCRCVHSVSILDMLVMADGLLYRAKSSGRNRVEAIATHGAAPPESPPDSIKAA